MVGGPLLTAVLVQRTLSFTGAEAVGQEAAAGLPWALREWIHLPDQAWVSGKQSGPGFRGLLVSVRLVRFGTLFKRPMRKS